MMCEPSMPSGVIVAIALRRSEVGRQLSGSTWPPSTMSVWPVM
jgi:hypothetical protein